MTTKTTKPSHVIRNLIIVLVRPEEPGNIGAAARAMKNIGLSRLHLVSPCRFDTPEALRMAYRSHDFLKRAKVFPDLATAIGSAVEVVGFTARRRKKGSIPLPFDRVAPQVLARSRLNPVALLFGPERTGLSNEELSRCHRTVFLPTGPHFSSFNLAQAVVLAGYTLRLAIDQSKESKGKGGRHLATAKEMDGLTRHLEEVLSEIDFLKEQAGPAMMRDLRQIFIRAMLDPREVAILRGMLRQVAWAMRKG